MHGRPRVYVRFRPDARLPALKGPGVAVETGATRGIALESENTIKFPWKSQHKEKDIKVQVDHAFPEDSTQDAVYSRVGPEMLDFVLRGFRGLICTYGITGSGKTHTMLGKDGKDGDGLAQRVIEELFLRSLPDLTVRMQAIQLHRNDFSDLGVPETPLLKVQSANETGAKEHEFTSAEPALQWLKEVLLRRKGAKTTKSSRAHFLLRLKIQFSSGGASNSAVLDLADLAGCEKLDENLDKDAKRDHITIQAGLSNLRHCIEAKVKNKSVPFTYFSLPRLLAPDFNGDASISFVINCPSCDDTERVAETSETLDLARFILRLELACKAQKATVQLTPEDLLKAAEHRRVLPAAPAEPAEPFESSAENQKEIRKLRKKLEKKSQEVDELMEQLERQQLAPRMKQLDLQNASRDEVRQLLKEVEKQYPEILQQTWPQWAEQLEKGADIKTQFSDLQKAVGQHEQHLQSLQWLLQRKEELQNESPEAPELQQLRQQQLAELDALLVAGASPEHREKLGSEAAQQRELQHKLAKKREELALLETSLHLAGAKDDEPVKADLREDLAAFGSDELQQAVEKLPGSTSILQHLLMAHPSWKQRFYQIGGLEKILEKMERTKKVFYHQRLAQCLCRTLDMDRVSARPDPDKNIARLVQQVLDITNGARFPLDSNSDEARILEYMELMEAIAQDKVARRLLVQGGAVAVALQFTQHRAQAVAAAALNALGQVASDSESEIHIPAEALRFALSILQSGQSARMKKAAAQCLQRLCYGSTPSAQELRRSLEALRAVPELLEAARHFQSAERQVGRNDGAEVARHVKNAALLMLNDRDKITPDPSHRRIVLEAMADATAKSFAKEVAFNNVAAGIQCFGHVKLGAWTARPITAGGPLQCSTSWMNPMYALRFQTAQKKVALAVSVVDPDAEARREQGASQQQRSLYHVSRIVTVKGSQSAQGEEKDQATFLEDLIARGLNSPLFWQGSQSSAPFMSEDVTAQHLDEMDTEDSHILMLSMGTALQEKRYVISVCADAEMELMPLSTEGWQRRSFLGHWHGEVPRSAQSMIRLQQSFPQLIITNASTSTASVCLVLSYSKKDTQHMKKHSWHEEDDEDNIDPSCPDESYPLLDVQLFDNGRHPIHRYMGGGSAVAKNRKASNEWVALGAKLPPCSTHNLVMSRCWAQAQEQVADNKAYQSFRLLVLSDCNELEMQPARCSNEWRVKSTTLQRVQETTATTLNLKLKEASGSQPLPQPLHLLVTTCADDKSPAYMMLQVHPASAKEEVDPAVCPRKDGKRVFLSHSAHYEYELSGSNGSDWTIKINYHPQCKPGFLVGMHVFSLCDVDIQWQKPSGKVDATSEAERAFVDEFYTKLPSWHDPHTEEDLQIEDSVFPPVPTQRPEDKEMVSVSVAYLQRLHRRALRDQRGQEE